MYIEFVIIYVLLFIAIAIGVINLILNLHNRNADNRSTGSRQTPHVPNVVSEQPSAAQPQNNNTPLNQGVAFCTKCAHQFPGNEKFCPYCGTPRN